MATSQINYYIKKCPSLFEILSYIFNIVINEYQNYFKGAHDERQYGWKKFK